MVARTIDIPGLLEGRKGERKGGRREEGGRKERRNEGGREKRKTPQGAQRSFSNGRMWKTSRREGDVACLVGGQEGVLVGCCKLSPGGRVGGCHMPRGSERDPRQRELPEGQTAVGEP